MRDKIKILLNEQRETTVSARNQEVEKSRV